MKITTAAVIFMGSMMLMRADQLVEGVQQALKDEGFYYGEVNGDMNANLTAAIRRYQIRNGLQVSGELNDETLRSLGINRPAHRDRQQNLRRQRPRTGPFIASRLPTRWKPRVPPLRFSLSIMRHQASRFFHQLPWGPPARRGPFFRIHRFKLLLPACNEM